MALNVRSMLLAPLTIGNNKLKIFPLIAAIMLSSVGMAVAQDSLNVHRLGQIYNQPATAWALALQGDFVYIAAMDSGMRVVDVSNPSNPTEAGIFHTPGTAFNIAVGGDFAYVAAMDSGLRILNVSNLQNIQEVGVYHSPNAAVSVAVSGNLVFVGDSFDGLRIVDISDRTQPHEIGSYVRIAGQSIVNCIAVRDTLVYIGGFEVINISDPTQPRQFGSYQVMGQVRGLALSGNLAFHACSDDGLRISDISNPRNPVAVGQYDSPGRTFGVAAKGNFVYVADMTAFRVVDVSDPANPTLAGFYNSPTISANAVVDEDGLIYVTEYTGLGIYRFDGANNVQSGAPTSPWEFTLSKPYPNPFNSTTRIGFSLPTAGFVRLTLEDLAGRKVAKLAEGEFASGVQSFLWEAGAAPSGVYVVRASFNGVEHTGRVMLQR